MKHLPLVVGLVGLVGCGGGDQRLGDLASQVTHEQARQNERMADASKAIAQGTKQLVESDAQARHDVIKLQQDLRKDIAEIGQQHDALELERKALARERKTESMLSSALIVLGLLVASLAPLILAGISLLGLWREPTREEEGHVLIQELAQAFMPNGLELSQSETVETASRNLPPPDSDADDIAT